MYFTIDSVFFHSYIIVTVRMIYALISKLGEKMKEDEKKQSSEQEIPSSKIDEDYEKWLGEFINKPALPQNNLHYQPLQGA